MYCQAESSSFFCSWISSRSLSDSAVTGYFLNHWRRSQEHPSRWGGDLFCSSYKYSKLDYVTLPDVWLNAIGTDLFRLLTRFSLLDGRSSLLERGSGAAVSPS